MSESPVRVDGDGVHLPAGFNGSCDVHFDDHHAWSFSASPRRDGGEILVPWPARMGRFLEGSARVRISAEDGDLFDDEVTFGSGEGRVRFIDRHGIPVMIDKWGLMQRPFSARGGAVVEQMVDITAQILRVLEDECGVQAWIAFGTLLGAAREGRVIGHDSDVDLAYLSHRTTPAEMAREMFGIARALRRNGMTVVNKSASFVTVTFKAPDGAMGSIDIYTCFYVGDHLHETATVRAVVPRSAVEPLGEIEFEGRMLPAPADPDTMLAVSYGPGWKVPDPSFRHQPSREVVSRFDGWFSSLMRNRRDWETFHAEREARRRPSGFARWVTECEGAPRSDSRVVDVGTGRGADVLHLARAGWRALGLDYARGAFRPAARKARDEGIGATFAQFNLLDLRDVLSRAAILSRDDADRHVLLGRGLFEALDDDARDNFWRFATMVMRSGGTAYFQGRSASLRDLAEWRAENGGGRLHPVDPRVLEGEATRAGGRVVLREGFLAAAAACRGAAPARWRMVVEWSPVRTATDHPETKGTP